MFRRLPPAEPKREVMRDMRAGFPNEISGKKMPTKTAPEATDQTVRCERSWSPLRSRASRAMDSNLPASFFVPFLVLLQC